MVYFSFLLHKECSSNEQKVRIWTNKRFAKILQLYDSVGT